MLWHRRDADNRCNKVSGLGMLGTEHEKYISFFISPVFEITWTFVRANEKKNGGGLVEIPRHILRDDYALALLSRGTFILTNLSYTPATLYALFRYMPTNTKVERHASGQWSSHKYTALRSANFGQKVAVLRRPQSCPE